MYARVEARPAVLVGVERARPEAEVVEDDRELGKRVEHELEQHHLLAAAVEPELVAGAGELGEQREAPSSSARRHAAPEREQPQALQPRRSRRRR